MFAMSSAHAKVLTEKDGVRGIKLLSYEVIILHIATKAFYVFFDVYYNNGLKRN